MRPSLPPSFGSIQVSTDFISEPFYIYVCPNILLNQLQPAFFCVLTTDTVVFLNNGHHVDFETSGIFSSSETVIDLCLAFLSKCLVTSLSYLAIIAFEVQDCKHYYPFLGISHKRHHSVNMATKKIDIPFTSVLLAISSMMAVFQSSVRPLTSPIMMKLHVSY